MTGAAIGLTALRDLLLPPRCAGCGGAGAWYCADCRDQSDPITRRLSPALPVTAAGAHEGPLRDAIHRLKYGAEPALAVELGALIAARLAADLAHGIVIDAVVPVRLHPRRERERGYDQARALAVVAAARTGLPVRPAVHRVHAGVPQATLGRQARAANVRGAFIGEAGSLDGLHIALVDDVATTGATLIAASRAARACGARAVRGYVVAIEE